MRTEVSLPDSVHERAPQRASELGLSRSEFFARAAQHYLDELDAESLTSRIDDALDHIDVSDEAATTGPAADAAVAGQRLFADADDEW